MMSALLHELCALVFDSATAGALRKLTLSRREDGATTRIYARLCTHKGEILFATERREADGKVYHKTIAFEALEEALPALLSPYMQVNLITTVGDVAYKRSGKGKEALIGGDKLRRALARSAPAFSDVVIDPLDNKKNYILSGDESFLIALGISDKSGRVHDKKQAKFRQINRFLEHIRDIEGHLPAEGKLLIYDLCCGKSYLSFAVYHYFKNIRSRDVEMLGMDLKEDCMRFCAATARELGFEGMTFKTGDIGTLPPDTAPHLVLSLHACDVATDIVLHFAARVRAGVILSTPCCQHDLLGKMQLSAFRFVTDYPKLSGKLAETLTDALRLARLRAEGYDTTALELTDPDDTPKNTLLRAVRLPAFDEKSERAQRAREEYRAALRLVLGTDAEDYPDFARKK
ncbi:MAG: SAM-dependent methyltransferase [Clostridia bacterium]|nr:SAM-dependent methyltransferase [Clostridia bacterium]